MVESSPPYPEWSLSPGPEIRIGSLDGPPETAFSRVAHVARLSDGTVVVADGASSELRWFGADGAFLDRAGGTGEGPGEFQFFAAVTVTPRDSVVIYDPGNQRFTWLGPVGEFGRTQQAALHGAISLVPFGASALLVAEERPTTNFGGAEYNAAVDSLRIWRVLPGSDSLAMVLHRAGRPSATWVRYVDGAPTATMQMALPFTHPTLVGAANGSVVLIESGQPALTFLSRAGEELYIARRTDQVTLPMSAGVRADYVDASVAQAMDRGVDRGVAVQSAEALLGLLPEGSVVPTFDQMLSDAASNTVWVRNFVGPTETEAQMWTVHDADGSVLAQIRIPPGFRVTQVGSDYVAGVERDELGVEYAAIYAVRRH